MKKKLAFLLALPLALSMMASTSFAGKPAVSDVQIHDTYNPAGAAAAPIVEFYDPALAETSSSTQGIGSEVIEDCHPDDVCYTEYLGSSYEVVESRVKQYDYGNLVEQTFLLSVAKGQTKTLTSTVTKTSQVKADAGLSIDLLKVIKFSLSGNYTGTITRTYTTTETFSGPPNDSPYNSRNYYSGVIHDLFELNFKRVDHYRDVRQTYDYGTPTYRSEYYYDEISYEIHEAQKPKIVTFSQDSLY